MFCYFVVLTPALDFLLHFNSDEFQTEVRARDYYSFVTMVMIAMGLGFQIPVGILAATRLRIVTPEEKDRLLRTYWTVGERQIETSVVLAGPTWPTGEEYDNREVRRE